VLEVGQHWGEVSGANEHLALSDVKLLQLTLRREDAKEVGVDEGSAQS
jgi:hypothetical protein